MNLKILTYLKDKGHVRIDQIPEDLGIPDSTLSGHLTVMKTAGLLVSRQPGHHRGHRAPISAVDGQGSVDRAPFPAFHLEEVVCDGHPPSSSRTA
ncbi:winged helix-turn-helix transcriptional regulator [Arachnia propionica]|uniref:winged helix-turn-helix domain-containing protein n=1 Tax=Arachnia propionica TaxID=1750 RepID=UPI001BABB2FB|nr:winged helix-turn-helix transcriptional regulator [Arachnia propionica]